MKPHVLVGLAVVAAVVAAVVVARHEDPPRADGGIVVDRVVDGDTLDVEGDDGIERIRLLNVDTPETVDPGRPVECLGPEASAFLRRLLPPGTAVTLSYDEERTDRYGRTLAGVFTADGVLVNAEIARQGLAQAIVVGPNRRFSPQVVRARDDAVAASRGLFSADVACTVPARVRAVADAAASSPPVDPRAPSAQLEAGVAASAAAAVSAATLERDLRDGGPGVPWSALPAAEQRLLLARVVASREKAQRDEAAGRAAAAAARDREAAAGGPPG